MQSRYELERLAWKEFDKLLDSADDCLKSFRAANVEPPSPLRRLLGLDQGSTQVEPPAAPPLKPAPLPSPAPSQKSAASAPAPAEKSGPKSGRYRYSPTPEPPTEPYHGEPPAGADKSWVSILTASAGTYAVALAVLREWRQDYITAAALNTRVAEVRKVDGGAGYTILERLLKEGIVEGTTSRLVIKKRDLGGVLTSDAKWIWAPKQNLSEYDLARHRREGLVRLLREHGGHILIASITKGLVAAKWIQSDVTDHLVKADLRYLAKDGIARKIEGTKEWEYVPGGKDKYTAEEQRPRTAA